MNTEYFIQGWMTAMEHELKKNNEIQLCVSFISDSSDQPFEFDKVKYYPINKTNKTSNLIKRILSRNASDLKEMDNLLLPKMLDIVHECTPDLIHIHGTEECFGLISDYVKECPIVYSIQGLISSYCEKFYSGIPAADIKHFETLKKRLTNFSISTQHKRFLYRAKREIHYLSNANYVIGRTDWDRNISKLFNQNVTYFENEEIMRTPFFTTHWEKKEFGNPLKLVSTLSPGVPYKGFETLLQCASLLKKYSNLNFEWQVIGYDMTMDIVNYSIRYEKISTEETNIKLLGMQNAENVAKILKESDIYCHTSHIENSPNSVCEAMLVGVPIVATDVGGTGSIVSHSKTGMLIQDGDPYAMAGMILYLHQNFRLAAHMAAQARICALQRHNPQNNAKKLFSIYNEIIKKYYIEE